MDHKKVATEILENMGAKDNIVEAWHCITRLRFQVKDKSKINEDALKKMDAVIDTRLSGEQYQVVIGNQVIKVHDELLALLGGIKKAAPENKVKQKPLEAIMDVIAGIFTPILPAIIGAGLIKGIMAILTTFNLINVAGNEYFVLNMISDAAFYYLPFLIANSAAKKFKANEYISLALAGILLYPSFIALATAGEVSAITFLGIPLQVLNYSSSVLPIIFSVWLLSYVYRWVDKFIPAVVRIIFTPLIVLLIMAPISLIAIAPLGNTIGVFVEKFFATLFDVAGPFAGFLMGGSLSIIVITGMQHTFIPSTLASLGSLGYDTVLLPMSLVSNLAQCGATLAVAIKSKNSKTKSIAYSAAISAVFGITEPAIYGVTLRFKKPFYAAILGGAVGGGIFGTFTVKAFGFGIPGITAIPSYIEKGTSNFMWAIIGVTASFVIGFIGTMLLNWEDQPEKSQSVEAIKIVDNTGIIVESPLQGSVVPLSEVEDEIFAKEVVGKGVAILPENNQVISPFNGSVTMVTPTNHAIGITSNDGIELLIHVGLDTVSLQGKGFTLKVTKGQIIKPGDVLLEFDKEFITNEGISIITPVVVTNAQKDNQTKVTTKEQVAVGEYLFEIE
ncbi:PTS system beta-glucosides-specific IIC component [Enterococcus sp. PF1-24]|uniref:beta-glucoside-specific PTS transporter subunit IIABC n=1 Tax=unclassified Enterococcus TaxID=2608891 RepID=UPI002475948F|nr:MULTISPECIES: beta-glucoside-specific PTS transporter subunit IIABC [unclassified Enterococcus]MDH6363057.1 PTS system beta-glucosides-specific IIC component [Enterococcus sp. PFB1-1]MDH6400151.1 PTS system beta-glucosides-specific IIC component [Enterococcus sp. PF1-24]